MKELVGAASVPMSVSRAVFMTALALSVSCSMAQVAATLDRVLATGGGRREAEHADLVVQVGCTALGKKPVMKLPCMYMQQPGLVVEHRVAGGAEVVAGDGLPAAERRCPR